MTNMGQRPSKISYYKMVKRCFQFTQNEQILLRLAIISIASTGLAISWFSGSFFVCLSKIYIISGYFSTLYLLKKYLPALQNWNSMKFDIRSTQESRGFCLFLGRIKDLFFFSQQTNTTKKILLNHCFELYI